ncbi:MAG: DUF4097 family beta strand repeat protein [Deltaproteobacteria bacterium]|nr:DUF4097 family beta strand repeat protein [Deltaproteobacteria bacterium]MBW2488213.1 DUF4097 family beta strand repeat protein [Deltaproteobacteria bacterium]
MRTNVVCLVMLLPLSALAGTVEHTQHLELAISDERVLQITSEAGYLEVYGVDGADRIKATATITVSGLAQNKLPDFLERHVMLTLRKSARKVILESVLKNQRQMTADAKIDLAVAIPKNLRVQIDDGSGRIDVSDLDAALVIQDDSGSIQIRDIQGNVEIEDRSGKIDITDIRGDLEIKDGSGSIRIERVRGDVRLVDGSGQMTVKDIDGNLAIRDGSGGIEIINVTRNVLIKEAGSGTLEIDGVKGEVTIWGYGNQ